MTNVAPMFTDLSPTNKVVIVCDGHGSHLTYELVLYCRDVGFEIVLRVPHTSQISQGEDTTNFPKFKPAFRVAKAEKLTKMLQENTGVIPRLNQGHLMELIKESWLEAFSPDRNRKAWAQIGVSPFTRSVFWQLKAEEDVQKVIVAKTGGRVNLEVLQFGKKRVRAEREEGDEEDEDGAEEGTEKKKLRMASTRFWAKGPMTSDASFKVLEEDKKEKAAATEVKDKRDAENERKNTAKNVRNLQVAHLAITKLNENNNDVIATKLGVNELKAVVISLNKKVVGTKKAQLLEQVQQLFPPLPQLQADEQAEEQAEDQAVEQAEEQPQQQETVVAEEPQQEAVAVAAAVAVAVVV
jgi:hypothetical protein